MSDVANKTPAKVAAPAPTAPRSDAFWQPLTALRDEVDRVFDSFWRGLGSGIGRPSRLLTTPSWPADSGFGLSVPAMDVVEAEKEYRVTAELPGLGAGDVELSVTDDMLTIKGEKKEEKEEKAENYYLSERRYGSFHRAFPLPKGVDRDRIDAKFDKGVLTITLPKTAEVAARQKKIEIKAT